MQLLLNSQDTPQLTPEQAIAKAAAELKAAAERLAAAKNESTAPTTGAQLLTG